MTQSNLALKSHRVTVRMTGPMLANLRRLAGTDRRIGEEIRNAIRLYLDDKGQISSHPVCYPAVGDTYYSPNQALDGGYPRRNDALLAEEYQSGMMSGW